MNYTGLLQYHKVLIQPDRGGAVKYPSSRFMNYFCLMKLVVGTRHSGLAPTDQIDREMRLVSDGQGVEPKSNVSHVFLRGYPISFRPGNSLFSSDIIHPVSPINPAHIEESTGCFCVVKLSSSRTIIKITHIKFTLRTAFSITL
jgi:hypothetical protein